MTPAAEISDTDNVIWGNIVDGGYFDNTGLHTGVEIMTIVREEVEKIQETLPFRVVPTLIYIKNNNYDAEVAPLRGFYETSAPVKTFLNSWTSRAGYLSYEMRRMSGVYGFEYEVFDLHDQEPQSIALGWTLSERTHALIEQEVVMIGMEGENKRALDRLTAQISE